ncbi:MAG TPA: acylneuraminate cytidylyltransferase family protein [Lachnospiraceae bacterium]|nr:acylneuraminate cytidylyltransferase family protein [Lachnospiraceae bacterium]
MYKKYKILAVVTARGGSKGLPGKNIKELNGKPLIAWTIGHMMGSELIDYSIVSTDSAEIARVSEHYGVSVPDLRPDHLSTDTASSIDVLEYVIGSEEDKGRLYDYVLLLEPTSPLRKRDDLDNMIRLAGDNPDRDGVISVGKVQLEHPMIVKKIAEDGTIVPYVETTASIYQRQQHDEALFPYGVGYLIKVSVLKEKHTIYTSNILPYYIERWQNYEIDDIYDFKCIETVMRMESDKL